MLNRKKVLGKGLGALITDVQRPQDITTDRYQLCHVSRIVPNRMQPRRRFDDASLKFLSESIREKGIIEPLIVRRASGGFELIAGERRLRAAKMVGLDEVPVVIMDATDEESLEFAIIENIQREDLNAIEEGEAYRSLMNFGFSQEEVARKVGKERATVANYLRLLKLPPEVKEELVKGTISMGHARAILSLDNHMAQTELSRKIVQGGLSVREAEELAQALSTRAPRKTRAKGPMVSLLEDELRVTFGTKVLIKENGGKGRIEIHYYSADDRERILELLKTT
jgi:ParB family chromosome partitioning protein